MQITSISSLSSNVVETSSTSTSAKTASFADALTAATAAGVSSSAAAGDSLQADMVSGRLGLNLDRDGRPSQVVYLDSSGNVMQTSAFSAKDILKCTGSCGIELTDLRGLGEQMDAEGIGYRPYELYEGTGSDHGIDFDDLINGGLGTAYDWRYDANAAIKGDSAVQSQIEAQAFAESIGLKLNSAVTTQKGIDPAKFASITGKNGQLNSYVVYTGGTASWYDSEQSAAAANAGLAGQIINLGATDADTVSGNELPAENVQDTDSLAGVTETGPGTESSGETVELLENSLTELVSKAETSAASGEDAGSELISEIDALLKRFSARISLLLSA